MMDAFNLQARLKERQQQHLYRQRRTLEGAQQPEVVLDGQRYLAFCSNDYLGLANDPRLKQSATVCPLRPTPTQMTAFGKPSSREFALLSTARPYPRELCG